jgi:hypothetical protein
MLLQWENMAVSWPAAALPLSSFRRNLPSLPHNRNFLIKPRPWKEYRNIHRIQDEAHADSLSHGRQIRLVIRTIGTDHGVGMRQVCSTLLVNAMHESTYLLVKHLSFTHYRFQVLFEMDNQFGGHKS